MNERTSKEIFNWIKAQKTSGRSYNNLLVDLPKQFGMPGTVLGNDLIRKIGMSRNQWDGPSISMFMKYHGFSVNPNYKKRTKAEIRAAKRNEKKSTTKTKDTFVQTILEADIPKAKKIALLEVYL